MIAPGDADRLVLRTTFGLLFSSDGGSTWDWVCERAVGFSGQQDPAIAVTANGVVLAGLSEGLAQSSDQGCSWRFADASANPLAVVDLTVRREAPGTAVALAWEAQPVSPTTPGFRSRFMATTDNGLTWGAYGNGIDPSVLVLTLDLAPSDPHRIYASGVRAGSERSASLFVSMDDGEHWSEHPVPFDARSEQGLYIAAVDPITPDRVYLRTASANASRLLVTSDGGASFDVRFSGGTMLGFALSPDGSQIYLGGPDIGLWAGTSSELELERRSSLEVACLTSGNDILYACSNELRSFALGASTDGGRSFSPRLHLADVRGPLQCPSGASAQVCEADWPRESDRLGIAPARAVDAAPDGLGEPTTAAGCSVTAYGRAAPQPATWLLGWSLTLGMAMARRARVMWRRR